VVVITVGIIALIGALYIFQKFERLFSPNVGGNPQNAVGWSESLYRGLAISTQIFELFGTDPLSGSSITDDLFDLNDPLNYALHHMDKNKLNLAFDNLILVPFYTGSDVHTVYQSMTLTQQLTLSSRFMTLIGVGLSKDISQVSPYSGGGEVVNQWITEANFKAIFPDSLKFNINYKREYVSLSLYSIWELLFGGQFEYKLFELNKKIQDFKNAEAGGTPHLTFLNTLFPIASERYLELAESMTTLLMNLHDNQLFTDHNIFDLLNPSQITLLRLIFNL